MPVMHRNISVEFQVSVKELLLLKLHCQEINKVLAESKLV